jgi:heat shock protein HslJ
MKAGRFAPILLLSLLTACGAAGPAGQGAAPDPGLRGRTFLATSITENGKPHELAPGTNVSFWFSDDGRLLAGGGCNSMSGPVNLTGGHIEVTDLFQTLMGCDQAREDQEGWLRTFLLGKPSWQLDGNNLVVSSDSTEITLLDRREAKPNLPLQATRWSVDTIMDGDTASSAPQGATLVFDATTVRAETGCNQGSASYTLSGNAIRFGPVITTKMACQAERMTLENAVLGALTAEVTYQIDADRLTLHAPSGRGLQLLGTS